MHAGRMRGAPTRWSSCTVKHGPAHRTNACLHIVAHPLAVAFTPLCRIAAVRCASPPPSHAHVQTHPATTSCHKHARIIVPEPCPAPLRASPDTSWGYPGSQPQPPNHPTAHPTAHPTNPTTHHDQHEVQRVVPVGPYGAQPGLRLLAVRQQVDEACGGRGRDCGRRGTRASACVSVCVGGEGGRRAAAGGRRLITVSPTVLLHSQAGSA